MFQIAIAVPGATVLLVLLVRDIRKVQRQDAAFRADVAAGATYVCRDGRLERIPAPVPAPVVTR